MVAVFSNFFSLILDIIINFWLSGEEIKYKRGHMMIYIQWVCAADLCKLEYLKSSINFGVHLEKKSCGGKGRGH